MGACAISGGRKQGYNVLKGIDRFIGRHLHRLPAAPRGAPPASALRKNPRPENRRLTPRRLRSDIDCDCAVPEFGAHDLEPPSSRRWRPPGPHG